MPADPGRRGLPSGSRERLREIRHALTISETLRGYFSALEPQPFDRAWHPDGADAAQAVNDVLFNTGLVGMAGSLVVPRFRINTVDREGDLLFVVTDLVSNRDANRV